MLARLQALPGARATSPRPSCRQARYFSPDNGARVDAMRDAIDGLTGDPALRGCLLTSLIEAPTAWTRPATPDGLPQAARRPQPARAGLREPEPVDGPAGEVTRLDAAVLAARWTGSNCAYLDPPYNHHSYFSNYKCGRRSRAGTAPRPTASRASASTAGPAAAASTARARPWDALTGLVEGLRTPC